MNEAPYQGPDPDLLRAVLARATAGRGFSEADLFAERRYSLRIDLLDDRPVRISESLEDGAAVRTAGTAGSRFRFTDGLDEASLYRLAAGSAGPDAGARTGPGEPPEENPDPLLSALGEVAAEAAREPACRRVSVSCYAVRQRVWILDESGRLAEDDRSAFRVRAGVLVGGHWGAAHHGGSWTGPILDREQVRGLAGRARTAALAAAVAGPAPAGERSVVLAAGSGGILLHEACGHLLEADYVHGGLSPYAGRLGQAVASPLVTAVDDPVRPGLPASQRVDDEGVIAVRKLLLDGGVLAAYLCGRREAARGGAGFQPGNARRRSFRHPPLPRMSNTMILGGETPPEEIIRRTARGVYAARLAAGRADPASGRFRFTVAEGSLIEDGRLTRPLTGAVISGTGPAALSAVDLVGNDARVDATAAGCTKAGQTIPVSVGHPTLRIGSLRVEPLDGEGAS